MTIREAVELITAYSFGAVSVDAIVAFRTDLLESAARTAEANSYLTGSFHIVGTAALEPSLPNEPVVYRIPWIYTNESEKHAYYPFVRRMAAGVKAAVVIVVSEVYASVRARDPRDATVDIVADYREKVGSPDKDPNRQEMLWLDCQSPLVERAAFLAKISRADGKASVQPWFRMPTAIVHGPVFNLVDTRS